MLRRLTPLLALFFAACSDVAAPTRQISAGPGSRQGGTSGGGTQTTVSTYNPLPTSAPAPGILIRESFGPGDSLVRPSGGKGVLKPTLIGTGLNSFWVEYPGSKSNSWIEPDAGQKWFFTTGSINPNEMFSPLQAVWDGGTVISPWFEPITSFPTAITPITMALPASGYELSMDGYPAPPSVGGYIAIGFTNSGATTSNFTSGGALWLRMTDPTDLGLPLHYELRAGGMATGRIIAEGDAGWRGYLPMSIRYSPAAGTVTLKIDNVEIGTYPFSMGTPKYVGFEGVGVLDNFILRQ